MVGEALGTVLGANYRTNVPKTMKEGLEESRLLSIG